MSSNNKRCSSGTTSTIRTQSLSSLSRSKTCGVTGTISFKSKPERLQPLLSKKNSQLNDETLLNDLNCLHPSMINELCLHAKGFSTIPNLSEFSKLQILDLSCNNLIRIENLRNLSNLRELKLYGNQIERIENLECLTQLQILQLQYNKIQTIDLSLIYLIHLQTLRIDSNKLSLIRSEEINKLIQLKILDISDCSIENLDFINSLSSLIEFRACHCNLKYLPNQFRHLKNLIDLNLSNNLLINIISLKTLTSLRILNLSKNSIEDIHILSVLIHLNELYLNFNQISFIPNTFEKLIDLQYLNLANNQINSWKNIDVLSRMNSLFILHINKNPFLSQMENYREKLIELCPSLELIDDVSNIKRIEDEQLINIDKELKEIDQTLENSIAAVHEQFNLIINDLQKLNTSDKPLSTDNTTESTNIKTKSKNRLFQALSFSEENYI